MYRHYAEIQGAGVCEVATSPEQDFALDVDAILAACTDKTRLIFICTPNNPTGTLVPLAAIRELLERRGDHSAIVIDEAYIEFAGEPSALGLLREYPNLVVLRTLSKALAFAGARCGTVIGPRGVIDMLNAVQAPYAMATPVIECVEDALGGDSQRQAVAAAAELVRERERLTGSLRVLPFVIKLWPSAANFFLMRVSDATALLDHTRAEGILLRHFGADLADCVRVSVGSRLENEKLLASLAAFAGETG